MPDPQDPQAAPSRLADFLIPAAAAVAAGVGTALSPRHVAAGVTAGLGAFQAVGGQVRLAQQLAEEKRKDAQFQRSFGRLRDYYDVRGVPSIRPEDMPAGATPQERADPVGTWLKDNGLPTHAAITPEENAYLGALAQINPPAAMAQLQGFVTKEKRPGSSDEIPPPKTGEEQEFMTQGGVKIKRKGPDYVKPQMYYTTDIRNGLKFNVGRDATTGQELWAQNTGEQFVQPQPADYLDKVVVTDPTTESQSLIGYDKRLGPEKGVKYRVIIGKKDKATFGRLVGLRSKGQTTGDPQIDALTPSDAADLFRNTGLLGQLFGGDLSAPKPGAPAATPAPKPDPLGIR